MKNLIEEERLRNAFIIEHTTSRKAKDDVAGNNFRTSWVAGIPEKNLRVDFVKDRSCCNRMLYLIYKSFRFTYVSFWFYFMPFAALLGTYLVPALIRNDGIIVKTE